MTNVLIDTMNSIWPALLVIAIVFVVAWWSKTKQAKQARKVFKQKLHGLAVPVQEQTTSA